VEKLKQAMSVFGHVMCQTYGQAEAPMIVTCMSPADHDEAVANGCERRLASVGRPSLVADVATMSEAGDLLPAGEVGEIVVRSSLVMPGYLDNEAQTRATRRNGGWHGTSDVGYLDEDGFVYVVDRIRDMIITGGFNVWPNEIEQVIHGLDGVEDCAVIGIPDEKWGEAITAVIETKPGVRLDEQAVIRHCKECLGSVKAPKKVILRQLPRSPVGKVLRRVLRDEYRTPPPGDHHQPGNAASS
jgi:acyl-CoA synthetase (AMP-forming)/AMP-acid ligase II